MIGYFAVILKYKFPEKPAQTRLEFHGNQIRMVIECQESDKEVIQTLLEDYGLVIQGKLPIQQLFEQETHINELQARLKFSELAFSTLNANLDSLNVLRNDNQESAGVSNGGRMFTTDPDTAELTFAAGSPLLTYEL